MPAKPKHRAATPAETLRILLARHREGLSPAERRELEVAATLLEEQLAPLARTADEERVRDLAQRMLGKWNAPAAMLVGFLRLLVRDRRQAIFLEAAKVARATLDDCTHPSCAADRERTGYSCCAGGHLARPVFDAIVKASTAREPKHLRIIERVKTDYQA